MLTKEQAIERLGQVGASDVPYLSNFDNKKPKDLWLEKTKQKELSFFENKYTIFGNITEYPCLQHFYKANKGDMRYGIRFEHKDIKRFVSSTDGTLNGLPIENKTIKATRYKGSIEKSHYIQLHAQMSCTETDKGCILYNTVNDEEYEHPILYEPKQHEHWVEADKELIKEIESRVKYFLYCMDNLEDPTEFGYKESLNEM